MKKYIPIFIIAGLLPGIVFAQFNDVVSLIQQLVGVIDLIIPLLLSLAVLVFIFGVIRYILAADPNKLAEARSYIIFSIVGIAVMLGVWSLALLVVNSFFPTVSVTGTSSIGCVLGVSTGAKSGGCVLLNDPNCKAQAVFPGECNN